MMVLKVIRKTGVRIPGLGSLDFGETIEVDAKTGKRMLKQFPKIFAEEKVAND